MDRFKTKLAELLGGIKNSAEAFDRGDKFEAIRIGVAVRVLLHQTRASTSLLTVLGSPPVGLLSSSGKIDPREGEAVHLCSLCWMRWRGGPSGTELELLPLLGDGPPTYAFLTPDQWWNQLVFGGGRGPRATRRDLVLAAANKDGGAHVDDVPEWYDRLEGGIWQSRSVRNAETIVQRASHQHLVMLRQIGYEILNSPDLRALCV